MIPLTVAIISLIIFILALRFAGSAKSYKTEDFCEFVSFFAGIALVISILCTLFSADSYKIYPVEYKAVKSNSHVAVATNYGTFKSDKIKDLNEWTQNKPGYIKVIYNVFGAESQERVFLTTKE